jgi:integrase
VRTSELIAAQGDEFDLDNARWDIPAERMKMKSPHIVLLSRQAATLPHTFCWMSMIIIDH